MEAQIFLNILIIFLSIYLSKAQLKTANRHYDPTESDNFDNIFSSQEFDFKGALRIPNEIKVMVKRFDIPNGNFFVDHVSINSYHDIETWESDYVQMENGVINFTVNVNYCDCKIICASGPNPRQPTSFKLAYDLTFDANNGYMYFKAAVKSVQVGHGNSGFVNMFRKLVKNEKGRYVFGPFQMPNFTMDETPSSPIELFDTQMLKEWIMFELSEERSRKYVWNYEDKKRSERDLIDEQVSVSVYNFDAEVSFDRSECFDLDQSQPQTHRIDLLKGDCLRMYQGEKCTGPSQTIVKNRVGLFSDDWYKAPHFDHVKSIAHCWRSGIPKDWVSYMYPTKSDQNLVDDIAEHLMCACPCYNSADVKTTTNATPGTTGPSSTVDSGSDAAVKTSTEDQHRPTTENYPTKNFKYEWQWRECQRINRFADTLVKMAKLMSVKVATATSDNERMLAAKNAMDFQGYMMRLSNETVALVHSISENNSEGLRIARFFSWLLEQEIKGNRTTIVLETASSIAMDTALEMLTLQAFIQEVCDGVEKTYSVPAEQLVEKTGSGNSEQVPDEVSENSVYEDGELTEKLDMQREKEVKVKRKTMGIGLTNSKTNVAGLFL